MKVIRKLPGEPAQAHEIENELKALQREVGGLIETVTVAQDLVLICNEEGRLMGLPENVTICGIPFVGTVLAVGVKGEEFASVKGSMVSFVLRLLNGEGVQ